MAAFYPKLGCISIAQGHRLGAPWVNADDQLTAKRDPTSLDTCAEHLSLGFQFVSVLHTPKVERAI